MSRTVDQRVVEMQFDNKNFERNVSVTMSTLDKLKEKLNFTGAAKGMENIGTAAKRVDMNGLATGVDTVHAKFSALDVMAVTALANITNSAVNAGKRIASALTIAPIKTGFQEYETQINAVQTILANTRSKGSTIDDVNQALEELNLYADKTIYNFTEMTRNIGTFTAAGIDLETSVSAIQGIANLAAVSGSTSQQASTAMYQLSQALAAGTVKLMDWNSVVNAGMGGEIFQNALKETSRLLGTGADAAIEATGSFRESLRQGWLTSEVLTETLRKFTTSGVNEYLSDHSALTIDAIESMREQALASDDVSAAYKEMSEVIAANSDLTSEQIYELLDMSTTAEDAATKVKTFTQLWDVMKESAQSGWAQTWKLIIGDFEEAKSLLTPLADFLTGFINSMSNARNALLESALGRGFAELSGNIKSMLSPVTKTADGIKTAVDALKDYDAIVDEIIGGLWGNGEERWSGLADAGYDWAHAQNLVNERLGDSTRHATEYSDATAGVAEAQEKSAESQAKLTETDIERLETLVKMEDVELKTLGYTEDQIAAFRELEYTADKLGLSLGDFLTNIDDINGRWLLMKSFENIGKSLVTVFRSMGDAWKNIFPTTIEERAESLFNILAGFHRFSAGVLASATDNADNFARTFNGVFAALDIAVTLIGGPLKIAFQIFSQLLGAFDMNVLDLTANIGDAIVGVRDWIDSMLDFTGIFEAISGPIQDAIDSVNDWIDSLKNAEDLPRSIAEGIIKGFKMVPEYLSRIFDSIFTTFDGRSAFDGDIFSGLTGRLQTAGEVVKELGNMLMEHVQSVLSERSFSEIASDIISGLSNGLRDGASKAWNTIVELATQLIEKFKAVTGVQSPSTVFYAIGGFIIAGLVGGLLAGTTDIGNAMKGLGEWLADSFDTIDFRSIFSAIISAGLLKALLDVTSYIRNSGKMLESLGDIFENVGDVIGNVKSVVKTFEKTLKSFSWTIKARALKDIATALLILVGALAVLAYLDHVDKLAGSIFALTILAGILTALFWAMNKISGSGDPKDIAAGIANTVKIGSMLAALGVSLLLIAATLKILESIDPDKAVVAFGGLAAVVITIGAVLYAYGKWIPSASAKSIAGLGSTLLLLSSSLLIMSGVIKMLGGMKVEQLDQGLDAIVKIGGMFIAVVTLMAIVDAASKGLGGNIDYIGNVLLKMSVAFLIMASVAKIFGSMDEATIENGKNCIFEFGVLMAGMVAMTRLAGGKSLDKLGRTLIAMSISLGIMALVVKMLGSVELPALVIGTVAVGYLAGIMAGLVYSTQLVGEKDLKRVGTTLLAMSIAIGILGAIAALLGLLEIKQLAKGIIAVGLLSGMMAAMVWATKGAQDVKGNITAMAVAIGAMAVAVVALSFLDPVKMMTAVSGLSILILAFTLLIDTAGKTKGALSTLITMTVAVGLLGGMLYLLAQLPVESTLGSAVALSLLVLSLSGILMALNKVSPNVGSMLYAVLGLTAMAIPLLAFVGILALMQNVNNATSNVLALVGMATALTILMVPLTAIGMAFTATGGGLLIGIIALTAMAVPMAAFVGVLAMMSGIEDAATNAAALGKMMLTLTIMLGILAVIGPFALVGVGAMAALVLLIAAVGIFATSIGALMEKYPELETFLNKGIPVLEKVAYAIGSFVGNIIKGFAESLFSTLPALGTALSGFMIGAMPFITGIKMVDISMLEGVGTLTAAILLLTGADFIHGIASFMSGGSSLAELGSELSLFMVNAMPFIVGAQMIKEETIAGVKTLSAMIIELTRANFLESINIFSKETGLETFGAQLVPFGEQMVAFANTVSGIDESAVLAAANAGKMLAEMAAAIPNSGGFVAAFAGENDITTFSIQIVAFGKGIAEFSKAVAGGIDEEAVTAAVNAGKIISEWASTLPNSGGVVGFFTGNNDLETFAAGITKFGEAMTTFSNDVKGSVDEEAVSAAVNAGKIISEWSATLPNSGGVVSWFTGDNDMATFGSQLVSFGNAMVDFSTTVKGNIDAEAVTAAANAGMVMSTLAQTLPDSGGVASWFKADNDLSTFGAEMATFGTYIKTYSDHVKDINSTAMGNAITQCRRVVDLAKSLAGVDMSGLSSLGTALGELGKTGVDKFVEAFENAESRVIKAIEDMVNLAATAIDNKNEKFETAGNKAAENFATGIDDKAYKAENKAKTMATDSADEIEDKYSSFYDAGEYLVKGFASGISDYTYLAEAKAAAMAKASLKAAQDALDINSPSRATREFGRSYGLGFVSGIDEYTIKAARSGESIADSAKNGLSKAVSRIKDILDSDMETQPTIRPVMDLSDVEHGTSVLSKMFGTGSKVAMATNIGSLSTSMNRRRVVSTNDDVVAAIDKLRGDISHMDKPSYNINGISYSDNAEVEAAFQTIIRHAKIERRS